MLLEVADSSMTYRSRYFTTLQPEPVLDLLMADENNPRSLAFQLADLGEHFDRLPTAEVAGTWTVSSRSSQSHWIGSGRLTSMRCARPMRIIFAHGWQSCWVQWPPCYPACRMRLRTATSAWRKRPNNSPQCNRGPTS